MVTHLQIHYINLNLKRNKEYKITYLNNTSISFFIRWKQMGSREAVVKWTLSVDWKAETQILQVFFNTYWNFTPF